MQEQSFIVGRTVSNHLRKEEPFGMPEVANEGEKLQMHPCCTDSLPFKPYENSAFSFVPKPWVLLYVFNLSGPFSSVCSFLLLCQENPREFSSSLKTNNVLCNLVHWIVHQNEQVLIWICLIQGRWEVGCTLQLDQKYFVSSLGLWLHCTGVLHNASIHKRSSHPELCLEGWELDTNWVF